MNKDFDENKPIEEETESALGEWSFKEGDKVLTIKRTSKDEFFDRKTSQKEGKICVWFEEETLPLILNKTNIKTLKQVCGSNIPMKWRGKKVIVGRSFIHAFGEDMWAVRIRPEQPKESATELITPEQIAQINGLIETGAITNANMMLKYYKVSRLEEMSRAEAEQLIKQKSAGI